MGLSYGEEYRITFFLSVLRRASLTTISPIPWWTGTGLGALIYVFSFNFLKKLVSKQQHSQFQVPNKAQNLKYGACSARVERHLTQSFSLILRVFNALSVPYHIPLPGKSSCLSFSETVNITNDQIVCVCVCVCTYWVYNMFILQKFFISIFLPD